MNTTADPVTLTVVLPEPPPKSKFEREKAAFYRLLPDLLATHRGQYVAIHNEQVVDSGPDQVEVAMRVLNRIGSTDIYVHLVSVDPPRVSRSGVLRDLSTPRGGG